jgi:hypothetical protein
MSGVPRMRASRKLHHDTFKVLDTTTVDNATWYSVQCSSAIAKWLHEDYKDKEDNYWYHHPSRSKLFDNIFDIHEKIYTILSLKWRNEYTTRNH